MMKRTIFLLALTAVLVQSYVPYNVNEESPLGNIIDTLKDAVNSALNSAKSSLGDALNSLKQEGEKIVEQAKNQLSVEYDGLLQELNKIKEEAKALGYEIVDCLKDKEDYLKSLPNVYGNKVLQCVQNKVDEGKNLLEQAQNSVTAVWSEVEDLSKEFNDCSWTTCVQVSVNIGKKVISLPVDIAGIASDALSLVQSLYPDLQKCGTYVVKDFLNEGNRIVGDVKRCFKSKINK